MPSVRNDAEEPTVFLDRTIRPTYVLLEHRMSALRTMVVRGQE